MRRRDRGTGARRGRWTGAGSSGSTAAARSPTWWPAARTARSPCTSCCRRTPARYGDAAVAGIRHLLGRRRRRADSRRTDQPWSAWAPRWRPTPCWSARASRPSWSSPAGFADALRIAYQDRPRIFDRQIILPEMLYSRVIEAAERIGAHGEVHRPARRRAASPGTCGPPTRDGFRVGGGRLHARLPLPGARGADRRDRPRGRLHPGVGCRTRPAR